MKRRRIFLLAGLAIVVGVGLAVPIACGAVQRPDDPSLTWAKAFGVSSTLGMMSRVSFLVGPDGKVAKVYPDVDPGVHAEEVLRDASALR